MTLPIIITVVVFTGAFLAGAVPVWVIGGIILKGLRKLDE